MDSSSSTVVAVNNSNLSQSTGEELGFTSFSSSITKIINESSSGMKIAGAGTLVVSSLGSLFWYLSKKRKQRYEKQFEVLSQIKSECHDFVDEEMKSEKKKCQKIGILMVNLGTPSQATPNSVHAYLSQFLMDGRVVDVNYWFRLLLVRGIIVPFRYKYSTANYQQIWKSKDFTKSEASPLKFNSESLLQKIKENLKEANDENVEYQIELAMRYQQPSIESGLKKLENCSHIVILPLFPQYASATVGSIHEECMRIVMKWLTIPNLHFTSSYQTLDLFIKSNVKKIKESLEQTRQERENEPFDHILFTYHSLPERHVVEGYKEKQDLQFSYYRQCFETSVSLLKELFHYSPNELTQDDTNCGWFTYTRKEIDPTHDRDEFSSNFSSTLKISTCFQSRLGKEPWLQPYTSKVLKSLAKEKSRVLVVCPSFTSDCIETDHELEIEEKEEFYHHGGKYMAVVKCVNDDQLFAQGLTNIITSYKNVVL